MSKTYKDRDVKLKLIQSNIEKYGHHIYLISGEALPRFAYTIGVSESIGAELILAGASFYSADEVKKVINKFAEHLRTHAPSHRLGIEIDSLGMFTLHMVDASWAKPLMLGALDFYKKAAMPAMQIVPDSAHWTVDVPDMTQPWSVNAEPAWQWLHESWKYPVPSQSIAITNLDALRGEKVTEAARWEEGEWELFAGAGPDVLQEEVRAVPLATLLAIDHSLHAVMGLEVGQAIWRDAIDLEWHQWGRNDE